MSDIYRGRTVIQVGEVWHEAVIASGFFTLGTSWSPNAHFEVLPDRALVDGLDSFVPHDPRNSPFLTIGARVPDRNIHRCKTRRIGRVACLNERDFVLVHTVDPEVLTGAYADLDDLLDENR